MISRMYEVWRPWSRADGATNQLNCDGVRQPLLRVEDLAEWAAEAGQDLLAVQGVGHSQQTLGSIRAINASNPTLGVENPDQPCAGVQIIGNFLQDFARSIVR